ncbi:MAG: hypothetical protein OEY63_03740 [Gemmatimonadota bacterium]|nr:hypothetical protein [Gemmatimonadota bacterium]MDH5803752.1 hypothetical protein [Gemmatimonadota bacterium]
MAHVEFAGHVLERIRKIEQRFDERAYLFVLMALEYGQRRRPERGHMSGQELAWACRDLALNQYGLIAKSVVNYWGIDKTRDFGKIVYDLISVGLFMKDESDRLEDFDDVYDFAEAFDQGYRWAGADQTGVEPNQKGSEA